jgi:cell division protein FtsL
VPAIEVMVFLFIAIAMTAVCFRQLTFWTCSLFVPKINTSKINNLQDKLEAYQRELERQSHSDLSEPNIKEQLNTI